MNKYLAVYCEVAPSDTEILLPADRDRRADVIKEMKKLSSAATFAEAFAIIGWWEWGDETDKDFRSIVRKFWKAMRAAGLRRSK